MENMRHIYCFIRQEVNWKCYDYLSNPSNRFHRQLVHPEYIGNIGDAPGDGEEHLLADKKLKAIEEALPYLPGNRQTIMTLYFKYGYSYKRIARRFGTSGQSITREVHAGLESLRKIVHAQRRLNDPKPAKTGAAGEYRRHGRRNAAGIPYAVCREDGFWRNSSEAAATPGEGAAAIREGPPEDKRNTHAMNKDTIVLTRRIQLLINSRDKEVIKESYQKLYDWRYACYRAANYIFTHLYLQEQLKELFYLTDGAKVKLADMNKDADGILNVSKMTTTYQVLSRKFKGEVPIAIMSSLNMTLFRYFNNERQAYLKGERSLRNYKKDIPIPLAGKDLRNLQLAQDERNVTFTLFGVPLRTYLGGDFSDKKVLLQKMMAGEVKLCSGSIQLKDNKIYFLAAFRIKKEKHPLDETIIAEANLSIDYPVTVTVAKSHYTIGNKEEFLYRRLAIQSARLRVAKGITYNSGGKGRAKKLRVLERYEETEKNYVSNRLHVYSRKLIDLCIRHGAGTLLLAGQQEKEEIAKEDGFLLRNWSYYELKEKIMYKAEKAGITVIVE